MATTSATTFTEDLRADIQAALESGVPKDQLLDMVNIAYLQMATATPPASTNGHSPDNVQKENQELPVFDALPDGLIDLPSAQKKYRCTRARFQNWILKGQITVRGRLKGPARGGGYLVFSEEDVVARLKAPKNKGGRPRNSRMFEPRLPR